MQQKIPKPTNGDWNGYEAWLRYPPSEGAVSNVTGEVPEVMKDEFERAAAIIELVGQIHFQIVSESIDVDAFRIKQDGNVIIISAASDLGLIYGGFQLLHRLRLNGGETAEIECESSPYYAIRMLNHWDDPKFDYTLGPYNVTRGFAGNSIFDWEDLTRDHDRYIDYARLLASTGINATCINNVNADPDLLESDYLPGIAAMAERLRPYGIRLYLSVCFSAPMVTDGIPGEGEYGLEYPFNMRNRKVREGCLDTADPRDPRVQDWWSDKVNEIYRLIPDFGGFVIKANSEGMPGPQDYGLTHADGANCVARALAPHGGTLFWRTFVYGGTLPDAPPTDPRGDGVCQPYLEFCPLDGEFDQNVILQTKNGPADFRADEPPSSLLGAVPQTRQAVEFMIAQEYLGHTTHVCYQAPHWSGILNFDTHHAGPGSTVAAVTAGRHRSYQQGAVVGVANMGDSANWFGHLLAGANAYAFGRLAWNPAESDDEITRDWCRLTFGAIDEVCKAAEKILSESYKTFARYSAPLGMGYMHESQHHYEPKDRFTPRTCDATGIGYDRTMATGSQYTAQYADAVTKLFESADSCPTRQLLFFHRLPWDHEMPDGRNLAEYLREDRIAAVEVVQEWIEAWRGLCGKPDPATWAHVYEKLNQQYIHAGKWRDVGLEVIERFNHDPLMHQSGQTRELAEA